MPSTKLSSHFSISFKNLANYIVIYAAGVECFCDCCWDLDIYVFTFFVVLLDEFGMIDLFQSLLNREYFFIEFLEVLVVPFFR